MWTSDRIIPLKIEISPFGKMLLVGIVWIAGRSRDAGNENSHHVVGLHHSLWEVLSQLEGIYMIFVTANEILQCLLLKCC